MSKKPTEDRHILKMENGRFICDDDPTYQVPPEVEILSAIMSSPYHLIADGYRDTSTQELLDVIKIIRRCPLDKIPEELNTLYKHDPATIAVDEEWSSINCSGYQKGLCDCFMPDIDFKDCYCKRARREKLKRTDYRNTPEYKEWRMSVFKRDYFICQDCGKRKKTLNAHHIKTFKGYPDERYNIDNGVTLCVKCHNKRHKKMREVAKRGAI